MLSFLADTNLWLRFVDADSAHHALSVKALEEMTANGKVILVPQNLMEFWVVATRPTEANGLGWTTEEAANRLSVLSGKYELRADNPDLFARWFKIVKQHNVRGKRAHDARMAAAALSQGVDFLVTFNTADFQSWPIKTVHPIGIAALIKIP